MFFKVAFFKRHMKRCSTSLIIGAFLVAQMVKKIHLQCRRSRFDPWVGKIPWRREWLPTPVFLLGEFHGQKTLVGLQSMGSQTVGQDITSHQTESLSSKNPQTINAGRYGEKGILLHCWLECKLIQPL